ncbi:hypothetical protein Csa_008827 [Cucumis sativus]|nr:hypothetical protein Csa_008827 [Cucumis sativus]
MVNRFRFFHQISSKHTKALTQVELFKKLSLKNNNQVSSLSNVPNRPQDQSLYRRMKQLGRYGAKKLNQVSSSVGSHLLLLFKVKTGLQELKKMPHVYKGQAFHFIS